MGNKKNLLSVIVALLLVSIPTFFIIAYISTRSIRRSGEVLLTLLVYLIISSVLLAIINKLSNDFVDRASSYLIEIIENIIGGRDKEYRKYVENRNYFFDTKSLTFKSDFNPALLQVYIDLKLTNLTDNTNGEKVIWDYFFSENQNNKKIVILGDPGSGKTTLLRHIALILAKKQSPHNLKELPILLYIRDIQRSVENKPNISLAEIIIESLGGRIVNFPAEWFETYLQRGKCILLLDGLDEIADAAKRLLVSDWVQRQINDYRENYFVITSRPHGYSSNPLSGVTTLQLKSFDLDQVEKFIQKWYLAREITRSRNENEATKWIAEDNARDLYKIIKNKPALAELAVNPLLATMIATIHSYKGILPERRSDLYRDIFEVVLKRRIEFWHSVQLRTEQVVAILKLLAYNMMVNKYRKISMEDAEQIIRNELSKTESKLNEKEFIESVCKQSGILLEITNGYYAFAHLTFQEYAASAYILDQWTLPSINDDLDKRIHDSWWFETILLYAAQADATPIISQCLIHEPPVLDLAMQCANEALVIDQAWRNELNQKIDNSIESLNPEERKNAARAKLRSRTRQGWMLRLSDKVSIDESLISNIEYQLFVEEAKEQKEYHYPDVWVEDKFPKNNGKLPVLGIRYDDAVKFCEWLSKKDIWSAQYRIPTRKEAEASSLQIAGGSYWVTNDGVIELYPPANISLYSISQVKMISALLADLDELVILGEAIEWRKVHHRPTEELLPTYLPVSEGRATGRTSQGSGGIAIEAQIDIVREREKKLKCYDEVSHYLFVDINNIVDICTKLFLGKVEDKNKFTSWLKVRSMCTSKNHSIGNWHKDFLRDFMDRSELDGTSTILSNNIIRLLTALETRSWHDFKTDTDKENVYKIIRWITRVCTSALGYYLSQKSIHVQSDVKQKLTESCNNLIVEMSILEERMKNDSPVIESLRIVKQ